jgi:L,D-transpeptidase catalytic domain
VCLRKLFPLASSVYLLMGTVHVSAKPPALFSQTEFAALLNLAPALSPKAIQAALLSLSRLQARGTPVRTDVLAVIDYTRPSTERRFWVFDLIHRRVLFQELAAHGRNSGDQMAVRFSNEPSSLMSNIGVLMTGDTYIGKHGLSLRLQGLEKGINDNCSMRDIVIHGAAYVSASIARAKGRIGRSWGCPAVRPEITRSLINTLRGGALVLAYYPDQSWLQNSTLAAPLPRS